MYTLLACLRPPYHTRSEYPGLCMTDELFFLLLVKRWECQHMWWRATKLCASILWNAWTILSCSFCNALLTCRVRRARSKPFAWQTLYGHQCHSVDLWSYGGASGLLPCFLSCLNTVQRWTFVSESCPFPIRWSSGQHALQRLFGYHPLEVALGSKIDITLTICKVDGGDRSFTILEQVFILRRSAGSILFMVDKWSCLSQSALTFFEIFAMLWVPISRWQFPQI